MADYLLLGTFTDDDAATIQRHPERIAAVNAELARLGVEVREPWALAGVYDFVVLVTAPAGTVIERIVVTVESQFMVRLTTLAATAIVAADRELPPIGIPIPVPLD